jgi:hypothetical protein
LNKLLTADSRPTIRKTYRVTYAALESELTNVGKALGIDDDANARLSFMNMTKLNKVLKATDKKVGKLYPNTPGRRKLLKKTKQTEAAVDKAIKQLELM